MQYLVLSMCVGAALSLAFAGCSDSSGTPPAEKASVEAASVETVPVEAARRGITLDLQSVQKDFRNYSAGCGIGYGGDLAGNVHSSPDYFFETAPEKTRAAFREAGVRFVRVCGVVNRWQGERAVRKSFYERWKKIWWGRAALTKKDWPWTKSENIFNLFKEENVKILVCLDNETYDPETDEVVKDDAIAVRETKAFVKWLKDNNYYDRVIGFELMNEPNFSVEVDRYVAYCKVMIPALKEVAPEKPIGLPIAVYMKNDPDLAAVRARMLGTKETKNRWDSDYFNQWSGHVVEKLGETAKHLSHIIIHTYGGDSVYTCGYRGIQDAETMMKTFGNISHCKIWITEWRERSDEDKRCHRMFRMALWRAKYLMMTAAQPSVDSTYMHFLQHFSGAIYISNGKKWWFQFDGAGKELPDITGDGKPQIDIGVTAPLYKMFNDALADHPLVVAHFSPLGKTASSKYYDSWVKMRRAAKGGGTDLPEVLGDFEYLAATNEKRDSLVILAANTHAAAQKIELNIPGHQVTGALVRTVTCRPDALDTYETPGEPKPWTVQSYMTMTAAQKIDVPANSIVTITATLKKEGK